MDVVSAKFQEVTQTDTDWLSGVRKFTCEANGAKNIKLYKFDQYDSSVMGLSEHIAVQWEAHGRIYRATFGLGIICDIDNAVITYVNGSVELTLPARKNCIPDCIAEVQ